MTKSTLPQLDISTFESQIIWLVIIFGILYFVIKNIVAPYFFNAIESRANYIEDNLSEIKKLQKKAIYLSDEYDGKLKQAHTDASKKLSSIRQEANAKISEKRSELIVKAQTAMTELSKKLDSELIETHKNFKDEANAVLELVSQKLGVKIPVADVSDYLKNNR